MAINKQNDQPTGVNNKHWTIYVDSDPGVHSGVHKVYGKLVLQDNWVMILDIQTNGILSAAPKDSVILITDEPERDEAVYATKETKTGAWNPTSGSTGTITTTSAGQTYVTYNQ